MRRDLTSRSRAAFTLTELLVVLGLITVLISLMLPVIGKARAAANATVCLSNLRQLGTAWNMYVAEHKGRLPDYIWSSPATPDVAWRGYWLGVVDTYKARGDALLCPAANEAFESAANRGYGNAWRAWTGRYAAIGSGVRLSPSKYRDGSYGYNRYLTAAGGFGPNGNTDKITAIRNLSDVPLAMDCAYSDVRPTNGSELFPVASPPDLVGSAATFRAPEHWRFLLARHGRAINVAMADGSARRVPLDETYELQWTGNWVPYRLSLPVN